MNKIKRPIKWGDKARKLVSKDITRGKAKWGDKRDLCGWIIEFFGEHTRPAVAVERHISEKLGILSHNLVLWADNATIKEQVELFNKTLKELKVLSKNADNK